MKFKVLLLIGFGLAVASCESEYEERLEIARELRKDMEKAEENKEILGSTYIENIREIESLIQFHAKVSGNKEVFLKEVFSN